MCPCLLIVHKSNLSIYHLYTEQRSKIEMPESTDKTSAVMLRERLFSNVHFHKQAKMFIISG